MCKLILNWKCMRFIGSSVPIKILDAICDLMLKLYMRKIKGCTELSGFEIYIISDSQHFNLH